MIVVVFVIYPRIMKSTQLIDDLINSQFKQNNSTHKIDDSNNSYQYKQDNSWACANWLEAAATPAEPATPATPR